MAKKPAATKSVEALTHDEAKRKNIPTAEFQSVVEKKQQSPKTVRYPRNTDLDPQLVWRGKDERDWSDLVVHAPPLYIQEKVHPKVLVDDLLRLTKKHEHDAAQATPDLFADFNGIATGVDKTEFYQHDQNWSNRMILGSGTKIGRPMNVVHGFSAMGWSPARIQNCRSFIKISVTPFSSTQLRSMVSRLCSEVVNINAGSAFLIPGSKNEPATAQLNGEARYRAGPASAICCRSADRPLSSPGAVRTVFSLA
jgi:hypothetical protein